MDEEAEKKTKKEEEAEKTESTTWRNLRFGGLSIDASVNLRPPSSMNSSSCE